MADRTRQERRTGETIRDRAPTPADARPIRTPAAVTAPDEETIRLDLPEDLGALPQHVIAAALHRRAAEHLVRQGHGLRACEGLIEAADAGELDVSLAAWLIQLAGRHGLETRAAEALERCIALLPDIDAAPLRRTLARLYRKLGNLARARDHLSLAVQINPTDRRARRALATLALREGRTEAALEILVQEERLAIEQGRYRSAHRSAMTRARLLDERLGNPREAADAYATAAEHARAAGALCPALSASILAARALVVAGAPVDEIAPALRAVVSDGRAADRQGEAETIRFGLEQCAGAEQARALAALGEEALKRGAHDEAAALFRAAWEAAPGDERLANRLEAFFIQRAAWHDLAGHYRERLRHATEPEQKAQLYGRLAELLEDELNERRGAAEAYAAMVELTGDAGALAEQVRLLSEAEAPEAVRAALDAAVQKAPTPFARAEALILRAELHRSADRLDDAAADFDLALEFAPGDPRVLAGLAECRPEPANVAAFEAAVLCMPRGRTGRAALLKRLARLVEAHGGTPERTRGIWKEVLAELPDDVEAESRAMALARSAGDAEEVVSLLRRKLAAAPRGPQSREVRRDLADRLRALGRDDELLEVLRAGIQADPGDLFSLTSLAELCEQRGLHSEAAWALEGAVAATPAGPARADLWLQLGRLYRHSLRDPTRAAECEQRAISVLEAHRQKTEASGEQQSRAVPAEERPVADAGQLEVAQEAHDHSRAATIHEAPVIVSAEAFHPTPVSAVPLPLEEHGPARARYAEARAEELRRLRARVDAEPLDPELYRLLAERYRALKDEKRARLMREIADALDGHPFAEPMPPKRTLTGREWSALRHPALQGPAIDLFAIAGAALCGAFALGPKEAGARRPFLAEKGAGARACADALLSSVRVLGIRAGAVYLSEASTPPFLAVNTEPPRLLVGRAAAGRLLPGGELRFFAARALCTLRLDLLPLRMLTPPELNEALQALRAVIAGERSMSRLARALSKRLAPGTHERLRPLLVALEQQPADFEVLADAARHSANRAGLVVAGDIGPAVRALRAKRGATVELAELVRFAASDRFLDVGDRS